MADFIQSRFLQLDRQHDPSLIQKDNYSLLINGRIRDGLVAPITSPLKLEGLPVGKKQAIVAAANFLVVFVAGKAYWKDYNYPASGFNEVVGATLDPLAEIIYVAQVPESFTNFDRKSSDGTASGTVTFGSSPLQFSPQCLVCQDGLSQPMLIFPNGTGRKAGTFEEWTVTNREYVPIGKQMLYYSGKLRIVSSDGSRVYQSVTGRPLDFVVAIGKDGDKLPGDASKADTMAFRANFAAITAITEISSTQEGFLVCTERSSNIVKPSQTDFQFGEPRHSYQFLSTTGAKNQFSVIPDILGDTAFIDFGGIKTFNSILQTQREGKNSAFSSIVSRLFEGIQQQNCAAITFDNYALFAVDSVYGKIVIVYDTITRSFVGFDQFSVSLEIKQFAEVITTETRKLFVITTDDSVYELYAQDTPVERVSVYIGDFTSGIPKTLLKPLAAKLIFLNVSELGTVYATPFADDKRFGTIYKDIQGNVIDTSVPLTLPFGVASEDSVKDLYFEFIDVNQCWKFGLFVQWQFKASLSLCQLCAGEQAVVNSYEQSGRESLQSNLLVPVIASFVPTTASATALVTLTGKNLQNVTKVFIENTECQITQRIGDTQIVFAVPVGIIQGSYVIKLQTAAGFAYSLESLLIV